MKKRQRLYKIEAISSDGIVESCYVVSENLVDATLKLSNYRDKKTTTRRILNVCEVDADIVIG